MSASGVAIGAIAPHGDLAVAEACDTSTVGLAGATQVAMDELGRRIAAAAVDSVVVVTPHGIHVRGHLAVVTASQAAGVLDEAQRRVSLTTTIDRDLALASVAELSGLALPAVEVSFGGNNPAEAEMPLDWGTLIPLWHVQRHLPGIPAVIVSPARELSADHHIDAGRAIVRAARGLSRRVAVIASADQGHGHSAGGRYGYRAESATFDDRVAAIVRGGCLDDLAEITAAESNAALADSWWQMLVLVGALRENGAPYRCELLAYEAPTYYGMLTAIVEVDSAASA